MIDVLIIGAGPTGLMLANILGRTGLTYRIIDQNTGPAKESRAIGIQARSLELFDKLGLVDQFLNNGMRAEGARMYLHGEKKLEINVGDMARADTRYPFIFFHSQSETEKILAKQVNDIERETRLTGFKDHGEFVECEILDPEGKVEYQRARFLCGCDGSHSIVRKILDLPFKGDSYASEFLMADAKVEWKEDHDKVHVFLESGRIAVFFPIMQTKRSRVLTITQVDKELLPDTEETTAYPASLSELEEQFMKAGHVKIKLSEPNWVTRYHVHHRSVDRMREGNVFLLGDSAHIHSPVGAQGMNTGLQDANNLAWKLKAAIENPALKEEILESYQFERHPIAKRLIQFTDRVFSVAVTQDKLFLKIRNMLLPFVGSTLMSFPAGKRFMFRFISQLNIRYQPGLVTRPDALKLLAAGSRVPNIKLSSGVWLHDVLKGYDFEALAFKQDGFSLEDKNTILRNLDVLGVTQVHFFQREDEELFRWFNVHDHGLFLVRPDGYIGYCSNELKKIPDYPVLLRREEQYEATTSHIDTDRSVYG